MACRAVHAAPCYACCAVVLQARRAEEAKQAEEDKLKRDRDNATKRVAGGLCCAVLIV